MGDFGQARTREVQANNSCIAKDATVGSLIGRKIQKAPVASIPTPSCKLRSETRGRICTIEKPDFRCRARNRLKRSGRSRFYGDPDFELRNSEFKIWISAQITEVWANTFDDCGDPDVGSLIGKQIKLSTPAICRYGSIFDST